jgi:hypothetical protein
MFVFLSLRLYSPVQTIFPSRIHACRHLLNALSPLIGAESVLGDRPVGPGWIQGASDETIAEWGEKGKESKEEMEVLIQTTCSVEYGRLMRKVCGLVYYQCMTVDDLFILAPRVEETRKIRREQSRPASAEHNG